jgi:chalcone isomerase-like protein
MRAVLAGFSAAALLSFGSTFAAEVEGVKLADTIQVGGADLALNGAGVRTRVFFKVYVGALYLQKKAGSTDAVLADAGPKRVAMHLLRDLTAEQLFTALKEGLADNHSPDQVAKFEPQVQQMEKIFFAIKSAKKGDAIMLDYLPRAGTRIVVNSEEKGAVAGEDFYRALLGIWLGEKPVDASLKKAMLGG